ncbi:MAG: hypothetical protein VYD87_13165 [Pseudomonadota bacterium]|nr:hypothetical protein [Pseudomonadota bacterium]MEE3101477.1 hypothetical protein [Pseudomonadota bacterium]
MFSRRPRFRLRPASRRLRLALAAVAAGVVALAGPARACTVGALVLEISRARDISVSGPGVEHARPAVGDRLPPGAVIAFANPSARITLALRPEELSPTLIRGREKTFTVPDPCADSPTPLPERIESFKLLMKILSGAKFEAELSRDDTYLGAVRGPGEPDTRPAPEFRLPDDLIYRVVAERGRVAASWTGRDGALVLLSKAGEELGRSAHDFYGAAVLPVPEIGAGSPLELVVEASEGMRSRPLRLMTSRWSDLPRPPGELARAADDVRVSWLYLSGPPEWRMHAIAEAEAMKSWSFVARDIWRAAAGGAR